MLIRWTFVFKETLEWEKLKMPALVVDVRTKEEDERIRDSIREGSINDLIRISGDPVISFLSLREIKAILREEIKEPAVVAPQTPSDKT